MDQSSTGAAAERIESWSVAAAMVFLAGWSIPIIWPDLPAAALWVCRAAVFASWLFFAVFYLARLVAAPAKWRFVRTHVFDLLVVVLPMLQPLRVLRVATLFGVLSRRTTRSSRYGAEASVLSAVLLIMFAAAVAELDAERNADGATITSIGKAAWWTITSITTVGYGDFYPVTTEGRVVAALLMVGGITLLGVVTASLATWMLNEVRHIEEDEKPATHGDVAKLRAEVQALHSELRRLDQVESPGE